MSDMENNSDFNLQERIVLWINDLNSKPYITEADSEELRTHLFDIIDDLKKAGLDEEEAFIIASRRLGSISDLEPNYQEVNNPVHQMRKSLIILAGVLVYFLLYFFFLSSSKLLLIGLISLEIDNITTIIWVKRYLATSHFVIIILIASIYFLENLTVKFIENINLKLWHSILLLISTIVLGISDTCLLPITKNFIRNGIPMENHFYDMYFYFNYSFPLLICSSFVILYFKYFKKTKIYF
jgi:hypothetical protein